MAIKKAMAKRTPAKKAAARGQTKVGDSTKIYPFFEKQNSVT